MTHNNKKVVTLHLESWQKKMTTDLLGIENEDMVLPIEEGKNLIYGVHGHTPYLEHRMYLTEDQMKQIKDEAGQSCDFIELKKGARNLMYGISTE
jgi:hypothetical protein